MTERMKTWIKGFARGCGSNRDCGWYRILYLLWIRSNDRRTGSEPQ